MCIIEDVPAGSMYVLYRYLRYVNTPCSSSYVAEQISILRSHGGRFVDVVVTCLSSSFVICCVAVYHSPPVGRVD